MHLIEHEITETLRREEAAARLRAIADELASNNDLSFVREGTRFTIDVPDEVLLEIEIEVGEGESEIEISLKWPIPQD